jgi:magnesium-transporting ATPase (P-type)
VACQVGTAFAARTDRVSLRSIGVTSNRLLLGAIAVELTFAAALIYLPFLHHIFGTAALSPAQLVLVAPYPFIVWGADEVRRWTRRRRHSSRHDDHMPIVGGEGSTETDAPKMKRDVLVAGTVR